MTAVKIILFLALSNNFVIRIMFFYIFPLFFQELVQILLVKNGRIYNDRNIFFFFLLLCVRLPRLFFPRCRETSCFQHEEKQNNARGRDEFQRMIHMEFCYGFFPGKTRKVVNVPMLVRVSSSLQKKADHSILMMPSLMSRAASRSISC